ncbi:MAG: hypothetical protein LIO46_05925, partial [Clostridiales bacterium]|nr:hypothetical protein [Clostridiales bacterium]
QFRKQYPARGDLILSAGQITEIPVARPLGLFVANGYAAVGDSAAMTVPLIGSGIYNAVMAGKLLAETVKNSPDYRAAHLWNYQVQYMNTIGAEHTAVDLLKNYILGMKAADVDFLFEKQVINQKDLVTIRTGHSLRLGVGDMAQKGVRGAAKIPLLLQIPAVLNQGNKIQKHCRRIPQTYQEEAVRRWAGMYEQDFT